MGDFTERLTLPEKWKDWTILEQIGRGAFGTVYKIQRKDAYNTIISALKVIEISEDSYESGSRDTQESIRSYIKSLTDEYIREIRIMNSLKGNGHIVYMEDYYVEEMSDKVGWRIYIQMEYLLPFTEYYQQTRMSELEIIRFGKEMAEALTVCENNNVIHRDLKPANIFVTKDRHFKLGDFGVARILLDATSLSVKGSYAYMAPEVYKMDTTYDSRVDIYSLGLIMYRFLNRDRDPFTDISKQMLTRKDREEALISRMSGVELNPPSDGSDGIKRIILKCCAYDKKRRYTSAKELYQDLEALERKEVNSHGHTGNVSKRTVEKRSARPVETGTIRQQGGTLTKEEEQSKRKENVIIVLSTVVLIALLIMIPLLRNQKLDDSDLESIESFSLFASGEKEETDTGEAVEETGNEEQLAEKTEKKDLPGSEESDFDWDGNTILAYHGTDTEVIIPENAAVIGDDVFRDNQDITLVDFTKSSVTTIGSRAFRGCTALAEVCLPEKLQVIGEDCFHSCASLAAIVIPANVIKIGNYAFYGCSSLSELKIESTMLETVGSYNYPAFTDCKSLTKVTLSEKMTNIPDNMFRNASYLKEISIPDSVSVIGSNAFSYCSSLENITLPDTLISLNTAAFREDTAITELKLPEKLQSIGEDCFHSCAALTGITIPSKVLTIGNYAFYGCSSLSELVIESTVLESVGSYNYPAFTDCRSLTKVTLSEKMTNIPDNMFMNASYLKEISIPDSVSVIGSNAFSYCSSLENITLPDTLISLNAAAFREDTAITEIKLPEKLQSIGEDCFHSCAALTGITIPSKVLTIGNYAFYGCGSMSELVVESTVLESVGSYNYPAFTDCKSLTTVTLPEQMTLIPANMFRSVTSLSEIRVPAAVKQVGSNAFSSCTSLEAVTFEGDQVEFGDDVFASDVLLTLYGPVGSTVKQYAQENEIPFQEV